MDADSSASIDSVGGSSLQVQLAANFDMGFFFFFYMLHGLSHSLLLSWLPLKNKDRQ